MGAGFYVLLVCYYWLRELDLDTAFENCTKHASIDNKGGTRKWVLVPRCLEPNMQSYHAREPIIDP